MNDKELQEIKERLEQSNSKDWTLDIRGGCLAVYRGEKVNCIQNLGEERTVYYANGYRNENGAWNNYTDKLNDATFISNAHSDITTLISEVERLQSEKQPT